MLPHLKKTINQALLENGTYGQIVSHLERELVLNGLEAPDVVQLNTVTQQATQQNSEKPKPTATIAKTRSLSKPVPSAKREKDQVRNNTNSADHNNNSNGHQPISNSNYNFSENNNANNTNIQKERRPRPVHPPREACVKTNHSTEKCYFGANAANGRPPRNRRPEGQNKVQQRNAQRNSEGKVQAAAQTLNYKRYVFTL